MAPVVLWIILNMNRLMFNLGAEGGRKGSTRSGKVLDTESMWGSVFKVPTKEDLQIEVPGPEMQIHIRVWPARGARVLDCNFLQSL